MREQQRAYAASVDEATAAKHALEQRLATADEATAAANASLTATQDDVQMLRAQKVEAEQRRVRPGAKLLDASAARRSPPLMRAGSSGAAQPAGCKKRPSRPMRPVRRRPS